MLAGLKKKKGRALRLEKKTGRRLTNPSNINNDLSLRGARQGDAAISLNKNKIASPAARNDITAKEPGDVYEAVPSKNWSLYILKCSDGSFYTGITNDLERRFKMHQAGKASRYTRSHGPVEMLYSEKCGDRSSALIRECEVKEWPRTKKAALIAEKRSNRDSSLGTRPSKKRGTKTSPEVLVPSPFFS